MFQSCVNRTGSRIETGSDDTDMFRGENTVEKEKEKVSTLFSGE